MAHEENQQNAQTGATQNEPAIATEHSAASSREHASQLLQSTDAYQLQEAVRSPTEEAPAPATEQRPSLHSAVARHTLTWGPNFNGYREYPNPRPGITGTQPLQERRWTCTMWKQI